MAKLHVYDDAGIATHLARLPHWDFVDGAIQRGFKTTGWKATMMVVAAIGHLCEAAWHHPDLLVSYDSVTVRLSTHSVKGITDRDFDLAAKIEDVIDWRPGEDSRALTGPPANHALLKA